MMNQIKLEQLDNHGERMVPSISERSVFWAHIYRYQFAAQFVLNRTVVDVACGEGYGAAGLLKAGALDVLGIDASSCAVDNAKKTYNIEALVADATDMPIADQSKDIVVSFETIEHLDDPLSFLKECYRVLKPGGLAIVSSPDRNGLTGAVNHHHAHEMNLSEFNSLFGTVFRDIRIYLQYPRRVRSLALRSLAADSSIWTNIPNASRVIRCLRRFMKIPSAFEPTSANRTTPQSLVATRQTSFDFGLDQCKIRPYRPWHGETAAFMIAVGRR